LFSKKKRHRKPSFFPLGKSPREFSIGGVEFGGVFFCLFFFIFIFPWTSLPFISLPTSSKTLLPMLPCSHLALSAQCRVLHTAFPWWLVFFLFNYFFSFFFLILSFQTRSRKDLRSLTTTWSFHACLFLFNQLSGGFFFHFLLFFREQNPTFFIFFSMLFLFLRMAPRTTFCPQTGHLLQSLSYSNEVCPFSSFRLVFWSHSSDIFFLLLFFLFSGSSGSTSIFAPQSVRTRSCCVLMIPSLWYAWKKTEVCWNHFDSPSFLFIPQPGNAPRTGSPSAVTSREKRCRGTVLQPEPHERTERRYVGELWCSKLYDFSHCLFSVILLLYHLLQVHTPSRKASPVLPLNSWSELGSCLWSAGREDEVSRHVPLLPIAPERAMKESEAWAATTWLLRTAPVTEMSWKVRPCFNATAFTLDSRLHFQFHSVRL